MGKKTHAPFTDVLDGAGLCLPSALILEVAVTTGNRSRVNARYLSYPNPNLHHRGDLKSADQTLLGTRLADIQAAIGCTHALTCTAQKLPGCTHFRPHLFGKQR